jgi:hypothetical protein
VVREKKEERLRKEHCSLNINPNLVLHGIFKLNLIQEKELENAQK